MNDDFIFVSYAGEDRERVEALVQYLENAGYPVWWDRDIAHGQNYHRAIEAALERARCVIVAWSATSTGSEWVLNEASTARARDVLLPVLIDHVQPPLEFRHLQTADLRERNPQREQELDKLRHSIAQLMTTSTPGHVAQAETPPLAARTVRSWMIAAGALMLGCAALLLVAQQLGWIGERSAPETGSASTAAPVAPPPRAAADDASSEPRGASVPSRPDEDAPAAAAAIASEPGARERTNLFDPARGAQVIAAAEERWRSIVETRDPQCWILGGGSFAVVQLRSDPPARFDTLAVHVEATSSYNLKTLVLYAGPSESGPFTEVGAFTVPNYRNMRAPYHEFRFAPVAAPFVKLEIRDFQHGDGPNGNVCSMRLLEAR